ncbi:MAG TPA: MarR family transcriptional regulator [Alphaproteobacteria bacterium]|nr:MarR family transcriptional regulator [Alphaproteobacteria bacterium]
MDEFDLVELLKAIQKLEKRVSVALMYSGLRIPQFRFLDRLERLGQATVSEMSQALGVTRGTASVMTNELIAAHIVAAVENEHDRRSFHIRLTENGRHKLNVARSDVGVLEQQLGQELSAEARMALGAFAHRSLHVD